MDHTKTNFSRRQLIKNGLGWGGLAATVIASTSKAITDRCLGTAAQTEGPFYPKTKPKDEDWDLTRVSGSAKVAEGEIIVIHGIVMDRLCRPVPNALVEIWQACATGRYNHPGDTNPAALDPNFQYWGRAVTNAEGEYRFKTIRPGAYPASPTWVRPPHIHFKVHALGFHELTSQLYFSGDPLNDKDAILQKLSEEERRGVMVDLTSPEVPSVPRSGKFDIVLSRV